MRGNLIPSQIYFIFKIITTDEGIGCPLKRKEIKTMTDKSKKNTITPMGIVYDASFLLRDRSKKYIILYDLSASNLSFDKKVKILDIMYPSETHEQHYEEMEMSDSNYNFVQSI